MPKTPKRPKNRGPAVHNPDLRIYSINKKNLRNLSKNRIFRISMALIIVALVGYFFYHQHQINEKYEVQKAEFVQLETRMQKTMDQIVATVGQPYELNHGQGCGYTAQKYSRGQLNCNNYYIFSYEINSRNEGDALAVKMTSVLKEDYTDQHLFVPSLENINGHLIDSFSDGSTFGCDYMYDVYTKEVHNQTLRDYKKKVSSAYAAEYSLGCGSLVAKPLYQIDQNDY